VDATVVTDFAEALEHETYAAVPNDWFIAVGDIVGSTSAISAGRYKDVNLAGAATIVGILNACPGRDLPFAFGGDGGIVLIPFDLRDRARAALQGVQQIARNTLALDMRCALVPVTVVRAQGFDVRVAYHALESGRRLAMLSGGGIDCAEALCKSVDGEAFAVTAGAQTEDADLTGLSCRWRPLSSRCGVMLTAIVRARDAAPLPRVYRDVYQRIQAALRHDACPIAVSNLKPAWPPLGAALERAFGRTLLEVYGQSLLARVSDATGITIGGFDGRSYRRAMPAHSDYRKFADSLRMVIDCSVHEADSIEAILEAAKAKDRIEFGLHRASSALMTCFVSNTDDGGHVHFIDGADGGYALAAQQLKTAGAGAV
jgi:hypothetical protein